MTTEPTTRDAYKLLHDGALALARVEQAGMRIDVDGLDGAIQRASAQIKSLTQDLKGSDEWRLWRRRFGERASIGSREQLGKILFQELGNKVGAITRTGKVQMDEAQLEQVGTPFTRKYLKLEKLNKMRSTYLTGIRREVQGEYLHPSFNLHLVTTYRSSSDSPNFQNIPIRDPKMGKPIRSCFIPRDGHVLVEIDYGALEFRIAACHWKDEAMIAYACDPNLDVHRDMAAECFCIDSDEVTKQARFYAKNQFVFPTLYGSWYKNTAQNLWQAAEQNKLVDSSGVELIDRMAEQGVCRDDYERHVQGVEREFQARFPEWTRRKELWWDKYLKRGWFRMMSGFTVRGAYSRNFLMNCPVQGPAFHILLWSLTRLVKRTKKWRTKIVGQIHDSIVADVHRDELDDYLALAKRTMTEDVREAMPWVVTDLEIEAEVAETNWFEKKAVEV